MDGINVIMLLSVIINAAIGGTSTWNHYHSNDDVELVLSNIANQHPELARIVSLGASVSGLPINTLQVTGPRAVDLQGYQKPDVKLVATVHGDEPLGRELLLRLAHEITSAYTTNSSALIRAMLDSVVIHIVPNMNPDGYRRGIRGNKNGVDLNRNFPDQFAPDRVGPTQPETRAIMSMSRAAPNPVLCLGFHGGALVANYPWDGRRDRGDQPGSVSATNENDMFIAVAKTYADNHPVMRRSRHFKGGITNGAKWYPLYGGLQDWEYVTNACISLTIELADSKHPPPDTIEHEWINNVFALYSIINMAATHGIRCKIIDKKPGHVTSIVPFGTTAHINPIGVMPSIDPTTGSFSHLLSPGSYVVVVSTHSRGTLEWRIIIPNTQSFPFVHTFIFN